MGFETVAVSRGTDKREAALDMGADRYVDAHAEDPAATLRNRGGADVVLATAPSSDAIEAILGGLAPGGRLLAVGAPDEPVAVDVARLLGNRWSIDGWSSGHAGDSRDALELAARAGIDPWIETCPLGDVGRAFDRLRSAEARFRTVVRP
jgi:NADPH2:quinone reductase